MVKSRRRASSSGVPKDCCQVSLERREKERGKEMGHTTTGILLSSV